MPDTSDIRPTLDEAILRQWIGTTRSQDDRIDCRQANLLNATVSPQRPELSAGDALPCGWHWIYFPDAPPMDRLGADGHAALGDFLPPVALPKRMWAGTRLRFVQPVHLETKLRKVSTVAAVSRKTGRSGELCFVTVNHRYFAGAQLQLEEDHDIVYRGEPLAQRSATPVPADSDSDASIVVTPTTTLLFRYSALTFNGHRIHYDLDYCRNVERYPGLVVHAPLTATLMLGLAERHYSARAVTFTAFRQQSHSPLFHDHPVTIHLRENATGCRLWAADHHGHLAASAELSLS